jgi:hypothetical protein
MRQSTDATALGEGADVQAHGLRRKDSDTANSCNRLRAVQDTGRHTQAHLEAVAETRDTTTQGRRQTHKCGRHLLTQVYRLLPFSRRSDHCRAMVVPFQSELAALPAPALLTALHAPACACMRVQVCECC